MAPYVQIFASSSSRTVVISALERTSILNLSQIHSRTIKLTLDCQRERPRHQAFHRKVMNASFSCEPGQAQNLFLQLLSCVQHCRVLAHHSTALLLDVWSVPPVIIYSRLCLLFSKRSYCLCCHRYSNIWSYSELTVHRNECSTELGQRPTLLWSSQSCLCLWPGTSAGLEVYTADPPDARTGLKVPPVGTRLKRGSVVSHLVLTFTS